MYTILLVDDDQLFGEMLKKTLHHAGYEVLRAYNGVQALRIYTPESVDLVLTDLVMPEKEGIELILELRRLHPEVKIIAMSGGGQNGKYDYLPMAQRLGAVHTLAKPFSLHELLAALASAFDSTENGPV